MSETASPGTTSWARPALAGAAATFSGIGLARFAYVPLFPAMVSAAWVSGAEAGLLGAANLGGYLLGVLGGRALARRTGTVRALDLAMALAVLSFAGCGWNGGVAWLSLWRGAAGVAGGVLMGLAGPAVQGAVVPERRGLAGGVVLTGVGLGVVAASLGVPLLLDYGVAAAWLALAALVGLLWALAHPAWPATPVVAASGRAPKGTVPLCLAYGISAAGLVPHMVYFGDLVVRGHGFAPVYGGLAWLLFGLGALFGPIVAGRAADRWGAAPALLVWLGFQVAAVAAALGGHGALLGASALLGGFTAIGLSTITLARARDLAGAASGLVWVQATASFAIAQAGTGLVLAALFAATGSHALLFCAGLGLSLAAFGPLLVSGPRAAS